MDQEIASLESPLIELYVLQAVSNLRTNIRAQLEAQKDDSSIPLLIVEIDAFVGAAFFVVYENVWGMEKARAQVVGYLTSMIDGTKQIAASQGVRLDYLDGVMKSFQQYLEIIDLKIQSTSAIDSLFAKKVCPYMQLETNSLFFKQIMMIRNHVGI